MKSIVAICVLGGIVGGVLSTLDVSFFQWQWWVLVLMPSFGAMVEDMFD